MIKEFKATYENGILTTTTVYEDGFMDVNSHGLTDVAGVHELLFHLRMNLISTLERRKRNES